MPGLRAGVGGGVVKPMSDKRRAQQADRRQLASPYQHERCWVGAPECTGWAEAWHELVGAAQGGSRTDPRNLVACCNACNRWIEDHPLRARRRGWKVAHTRAVDGVDGLVPAEPNPLSLAEHWT